jgi:plasmid stabilization system protein ParE
VARSPEYLDEALEEAEAAARWYAERSESAALGFSAEVDGAEEAIAEHPDACLGSSTALVGTCLVGIRSASSIH